MRRRFEATVIWPETGGRYSKEIEVELTEKENGDGDHFKAKAEMEWDGKAFGMLTVEGQSAYIQERYDIGQAMLDEFENVCHAIENGDDDREWKMFRPVEIETPLKHISVRFYPEHILKLPFRYFTWGDGLMAFATARRDSNYVIENLLRHNLKCYGEYSILGYSRLADSGILDGWDVYHTDLPEWRFFQGVDASQISIERLPYDEYSDIYDDEF